MRVTLENEKCIERKGYVDCDKDEELRLHLRLFKTFK